MCRSGGNPVDAHNLDLEWAPADFDIRHRLVINWLWEIPFLKDAAGLMGSLLGGWQVNGVVQWQTSYRSRSRPPPRIRPATTAATVSATIGPIYPASERNLPNTSQDACINGLFKATEFSEASGNRDAAAKRLSRSELQNTGPVCSRASCFLSVPQRIQVRAEAFNVLNAVNLDRPNGNLAQATFGQSIRAFPGRDPVRAEVDLRPREAWAIAFPGFFGASALSAVLLFVSCRQEDHPPGRPSASIVLITIDTLRADHVNARLTPALAGLGRESVVFDHAVTAAPLTLPAHASLLTAAYPTRHGVHDNHVSSLPDGVPTFPVHLKQRGYATAAFVSAVVLDHRYGLNRGFDVRRRDYGPGGPVGT